MQAAEALADDRRVEEDFSPVMAASKVVTGMSDWRGVWFSDTVTAQPSMQLARVERNRWPTCNALHLLHLEAGGRTGGDVRPARRA